MFGKNIKLNTKDGPKEHILIYLQWLSLDGWNIWVLKTLLLFYFVSVDLSKFSYLGLYYFWIRKMNNIIKGKYGKKYSEILRVIILKWYHTERFPSFDVFFWTVSIMETVSILILSKISKHSKYCI